MQEGKTKANPQFIQAIKTTLGVSFKGMTQESLHSCITEFTQILLQTSVSGAVPKLYKANTVSVLFWLLAHQHDTKIRQGANRGDFSNKAS